MISVLILTLDEELNIADCIGSLPCSRLWRGDIHVLDSCSVDRTVELAEGLGASVTTRPFTNYADQRNYGLALPMQHDWIVMLDADERMMPELAREIEDVIRHSEIETAMFRVRRRDMFMGRWLRRSSGYPTWFPRVMRRGRVRVNRAVNETYLADGQTDELSEHLIHYPFNKVMSWWFARNCRYAESEAQLLIARDARGRKPWRDLICRDPGLRRAAMKRLAYSLPGRPFLMFLYLYVLRLGFLDGRPGYHFACMRMAYEIMIDSQAAYEHASRLDQDIAD